MLANYYESNTEASFFFGSSVIEDRKLDHAGPYFRFIYNRSQVSISCLIDGISIELPSKSLLAVTNLQKVLFAEPKDVSHDFVCLGFNRAFYCIHTYDEEVSCNGLLFFGNHETPVLSLNDKEQEVVETLLRVLREEFDHRDRNQEEMLRILLKRLIIRATRLARNQLINKGGNQESVDLIRQYNALVEEHYKTLKQVSDYANLLNRAPKTITNLFRLHADESPLTVIHKRIALEAKRLLLYTSKSVKEIGLELGFSDANQFSRFFKKQVGKTPVQFKSEREYPQFGKN